MRKIVIFGATAGMIQSTMRSFADEGAQLFLIARNRQKLESISADLVARGAAEVGFLEQDLDDTEKHAELFKVLSQKIPGWDTALVSYGVLGEQEQDQDSFEYSSKIFHTNFLSVVSLLIHMTERLESLKSGTIAVISSVAGDRGRKSNYVYGTAKSALSTYLAGLRNRLYGSNVHVLTILPGFVDTPMTEHITNKGPLFASSESVGDTIYKAIKGKKNVVYVPGFWRLIMFVIKSIPEVLFKRLSI